MSSKIKFVFLAIILLIGVNLSAKNSFVAQGTVSGKSATFSITEGENGSYVLSSGEVRVKIQKKNRDKYQTFMIIEATDGENQKLESLQISFPNNKNLNFIPLDYVTKIERQSATFPWLFARNEKNPLGKFAVFTAKNDEEYDDILMHLWVYEGLPHPKVKGEWDLVTAKNWLKKWQDRFTDQSTMIIQPRNNDELYKLTEYARKNGMKTIYMHTDTWRGEYWPMSNYFVTINKRVFPKGIEDFRKYSTFLSENNMEIATHMVSGGVARHDPKYIKNGIDDRLASWGQGKLEQNISANQKDILWRVKEGTILPIKARYAVQQKKGDLPFFINKDTIQINGEFIKVGSFENTDQDVWVLKNCQRGLFNTKATNHKKDSNIKGLYMPYEQVFVADNDSTLLDEMIMDYATFCNENNVTHIECDGVEIHGTVPWGAGKYMWKLYEQLSHLTTSNTSGGTPLAFHIEYWFKSSIQVKNNHTRDGVPVIVQKDDRLTTTPYELYIKPSEKLAIPYGQSFNIISPIPMFGVSLKLLDAYGLMDYTEKTINLYREISRKISDKQREELASKLEKYPSPTGQADNQAATRVLYRPEKIENKLFLTPLYFMTSKNYNMSWGWGQEFGPLVPWQYFKANESLELKNPINGQKPEFLIRIMHDYKEMGSNIAVSKKSQNREEVNSVIESYQLGAGQGDVNNPLSDCKHIWLATEMENNTALAGNIYFKKEFNIKELSELKGLALVIQVDDSATVYLNDKKVFTGGGYDQAILLDIYNEAKKGTNTLLIDAKNSGGPGCLTAAIVIDNASKKEILPSNKSWMASTNLSRDAKWENAYEIASYGRGEWPKKNPQLFEVSSSLMAKNEKVVTLKYKNSSAKTVMDME